MAKRRKKARRKNPIHTGAVRRQLANSVALYRKFREADPKFIDSVRLANPPKVAMHIGKLDGVLYTTTHGGKKVSYIHRFTGASKPDLVTDGNGKRLYIVGGRYDFTQDGIVDRK